jgi:hypothetical protein
MSNAAFVDESAEKVRWLVQRETRCPGDTRNAMERLARRHGIDFGTLWSLRYRRPKDLFVSIYFAIHAAYEAEVERQQQALERERAATHPRTKLGRALLGEVQGMGREDVPALSGAADRTDP